MAVLLLAAPFFAASHGGVFDALVKAEIVLIAVQLFVLLIFMEATKLGTTSAAESVRLLRKPIFGVWVVIIGLIVPLGLLGYYAIAGNIIGILFPAGLLLLTGNFFLRYGILTAGVRVPVYP